MGYPLQNLTHTHNKDEFKDKNSNVILNTILNTNINHQLKTLIYVIFMYK